MRSVLMVGILSLPTADQADRILAAGGAERSPINTEENEMDSQLVLLHFETVEAVESTMATIRTLEAEGFLELDDAALVTSDPTGAVTVTPLGPTGTGRKTTVGAVVGLVAGTLVGLPVLGAVTGGGIAAGRSVKDAAEKLDAVLEDVTRRVESGTTVLVLAVRSLPDAEMVVDRLSVHRDKMTQVDIPAALREQIERTTSD